MPKHPRETYNHPTRVVRADDRLSRPTIFIVDDDDEVREMIRAILEAEGYRTLGATNGRDALHVLRRAKDLPDLILCDLVMPIADGEDLVASLAPYDHLRTIPFVFMTGEAGMVNAHQDKLHDAPLCSPSLSIPISSRDCPAALPASRSHEPKRVQRGVATPDGRSAPRSGSLVSRGRRRSGR